MRAWRSLHSLPGNLIHRFHHACFLQANVLRVHWSASQPKQRVARGHLTVKKKKMMMTQGRARTMARMSEKPRLQLAAAPQRLALHSRRCPVPGSSWVPLRAMCARTPDLSRCVCVCTVQAQQRWCAGAGFRKPPLTCLLCFLVPVRHDGAPRSQRQAQSCECTCQEGAVFPT